MADSPLYRQHRRFRIVQSFHPARFAEEPVAQGVEFWDGVVAVRWDIARAATGTYGSVAALQARLPANHVIRWLDNPV